MEAVGFCDKCGKMNVGIIEWPLFDGSGEVERRQVNVACECQQKERRAMEQRMAEQEIERKIYSLRSLSLMDAKMRQATFDGYIKSEGNEKAYIVARNYVDNFKQMKERGQGLMFWGDVGTGKSYTAACIANDLMCKHYQSVIMTSMVKIIDSFNKGEFDEFMQRLSGAEFLIIDDFGAERGTDYSLEKVYDVIDTWYRRKKPLVITTNLAMADMKACTDIRYTRIYDRIYEMCYPVKVVGKSYRKMEAARRYNDMKELLENGITN